MHETATFVLVKLTNIHRFKKNGFVASLYWPTLYALDTVISSANTAELMKMSCLGCGLGYPIRYGYKMLF